jgi:hypothetical protein
MNHAVPLTVHLVWRSIVFVTALLLATTQLVDASTAYTDTIYGAEYAATPYLGSFAGAARGDLPGTFDVQVQHTDLSGTAAITGGTFTLYTTIDGTPAVVGGSFTGGSVTQIDKNTQGCRNQHYAVSGTLESVGVGGTGTGTGTGLFAATLTHYRTRIAGDCVTYFATISGAVSLTF